MQNRNFLIRSVDWLEGRRVLNVILVFGYFIYIYLMHVPMAKVSVFVEQFFTLPVYNKVVEAISVLILILYLTWVYGQLKINKENFYLKLFYLLIIVFFIVLHFRIMFEMNIEIIHVFQYSILAFLIFPLTRRFGNAVFFAIPFMLVDEWNQYVNLYPGFVQYFEFNDVILDINGCALAVLTLMIFGVKGADNLQLLWKRSEFIGLGVFVMVVAVALISCNLALYEADKCSNTFLVLNKVPEVPAFWRKFPGRDAIYHIMQPMEAIIAIVGLSLLYFGMDSFRFQKRS